MVAVSLKKFFFQAEDGIRDVERSRGLGDVYKRQVQGWQNGSLNWMDTIPFYFTAKHELKIGNFLQHGVFHYTEHEFCKKVMEKY